ncbi:uncharacterized protein LOC143282426 [Babylonia areolata]|uniref:uncharacterized protein LOC143282426 n=1 Tax=Babylonia areolata TaxID=304850 RepID=UPI003FD36AE4
MYRYQNDKARYNGRLDAHLESRLRRHEQFFLENLHSEELIETQSMKDVFNVYDKNAIKLAFTKTEKNKKLFNILLCKTPEGFEHFLQALLETGQAEAYDKLSKSEEAGITTEETAVQTENVTGNEGEEEQAAEEEEQAAEEEEQAAAEEEGASGGRPPSSPNWPLSPTFEAAEEQKEQRQKLMAVEKRVDSLAESVEGLTSQVRESNRRMEESEEKRDAKLEKLQESLEARETLLLVASKQIEDLRCKIAEVERDKSQALKEANRTIDHMTQEMAKLKTEKEQLEAEVQRLTWGNQQLRGDIQKLKMEKLDVQNQLKTQAEELRQVKATNSKLEEKLTKNDETLKFFVNKVEKIEMKVSSSQPRAKKPPKRGRRASPTSSTEENPRPQQQTQRKRVLEPTKQCLSRPNSRK